MSVATANNVSSAADYTYTRKAAGGAQSDADAAQDRFLKLLIAQLANQDPMNPMDNAQMTSQMAQINTVSGIQQVNASIQSMSAQFAMLQTLQGAQTVGRDVLVSGDSMPVNAGVASGVVEVKSNADKVQLKVFTPGGTLLETKELGALTMGRHDVQWSSSDFPDVKQVRLQVSASASGKSVNTTLYSRQKVTGVESGDTPQLKLQSGSTVGLDAVAAFF